MSFKLNYGYYLHIVFEKDINFYSNFFSMKELTKKTDKLDFSLLIRSDLY